MSPNRRQGGVTEGLMVEGAVDGDGHLGSRLWIVGSGPLGSCFF